MYGIGWDDHLPELPKQKIPADANYNKPIVLGEIIPFYDDNLMKLKDDINYLFTLTNDQGKALVKRLIMAECGYYYHSDPIQCHCQICENWRRAAGKS